MCRYKKSEKASQNNVTDARSQLSSCFSLYCLVWTDMHETHLFPVGNYGEVSSLYDCPVVAPLVGCMSVAERCQAEGDSQAILDARRELQVLLRLSGSV